MTSAWIHPTALIEDEVVLGEGTTVWDNVHIRRSVRIGNSCIIGEKTYIAYNVVIGDYVKVNASVYVCAGVTVEDFCMISAHVVFTNHRYPRAGNRELTGLETSKVTGETLSTRVCMGTTVGANATIGPGMTLGAFSMIGMGSVVTHDVLPHALVLGNPARQVGWVCRCGHMLIENESQRSGEEQHARCASCGREYNLRADGAHED